MNWRQVCSAFLNQQPGRSVSTITDGESLWFRGAEFARWRNGFVFVNAWTLREMGIACHRAVIDRLRAIRVRARIGNNGVRVGNYRDVDGATWFRLRECGTGERWAVVSGVPPGSPGSLVLGDRRPLPVVMRSRRVRAAFDALVAARALQRRITGFYGIFPCTQHRRLEALPLP